MKAVISFAVLSLIANLAQANSNKLTPFQPQTGIVCNDAGIDVLTTSRTANTASMKISANAKTLTFPMQAVKNGNVLSYTSGENKLDVDFDRTLPGTDMFQGELNMEFDGARIHLDIPCRLLFMTGKQPSLTAWQ